MNAYIQQHLGLDQAEANQLRALYWRRYGATLLGLKQHHQIDPHHFLAQTHQLPELERHIASHRHDLQAVKRLRGRKYLLTNAPSHYAHRVLKVIGMNHVFDAVLSIEDMQAFNTWRPKPSRSMLKIMVQRLKLRPDQCLLVEDNLENQKVAQQMRMRTIWMQRYIGINSQAREVSHRSWGKPQYVYAKMKSLHHLLRLHV